jgi:hypothetical protein
VVQLVEARRCKPKDRGFHSLRCFAVRTIVLGSTQSLREINKGTVHPITRYEGLKVEQKYSSTLSLTSALDVDGWRTPRPSRFTPGKTRYPLYRWLDGPQSRSGRVRKISLPPGFDPQTIQPIASSYNDCVIPALNRNEYQEYFLGGSWG